MNGSFLRVGVLLGGAAIIATAVGINSAAATGVRGPVVPDKITTCNKPSPCIGGTNTGSGPGVEGVNEGSGNGVYALAYYNDGVNGTTASVDYPHSRSGVRGVDNSTDGGNGNAGVSGSSANGVGVFGTSAYSPYNLGVFGQSTSSFGVVAQSGQSVSLAASPAGSGNLSPTIVPVGNTYGDSNGYSLATYQNNGTPAFWVDNNSNAHVNGLIYTLGSCSGGCARGRGARVASYAAQSSTPILEDNGEGRLNGGQARIAIDPSLARAIDQGASYAVSISAEGPSHGLYVTAKTSTGFRVVENDGGSSTIAFSYHIEAKPFGVHAARLPMVTVARMPHAVPVRAPKEFPR